MPGFSSAKKLFLGRGLKAFFDLKVGLVRGPTPDEQVEALQDRVQRQAEELQQSRAQVREEPVQPHELTALSQDSQQPGMLMKANQQALARRPYLKEGYEFRPISPHNRDFHEIKDKYPYFGYVEAHIAGVPPFVMFSNNDDRVAQIYFWYGPNTFESLSLRIWSELARHRTNIFDVGAYTGVYALTAAQANHSAHVHCFEPIKRVFGRLVVNLTANRHYPRVKAHNLAISDTDGEAVLNVFTGRFTNLLTGASLVEKGHRKAVGGEPAKTLRLDTFVEENDISGADLIKIDVEQAERKVLAGMEEVLEKHRPDLLVEVISEQELREISDMLSPHGYSFAVVDDTSQTTHVNDFGAHSTARNVLFSTTTQHELRAFCATFKPLYARKGGSAADPA